MAELPSDPAQEKERLSITIGTLHQQWGERQMAQADTALLHAMTRAEHALSVLQPQPQQHGLAFRIHV